MKNKTFQIMYAKMMLPKLKFALQSEKPMLIECRLRNAIHIIEKLLEELENKGSDLK